MGIHDTTRAESSGIALNVIFPVRYSLTVNRWPRMIHDSKGGTLYGPQIPLRNPTLNATPRNKKKRSDAPQTTDMIVVQARTPQARTATSHMRMYILLQRRVEHAHVITANCLTCPSPAYLLERRAERNTSMQTEIASHFGTEHSQLQLVLGLASNGRWGAFRGWRLWPRFFSEHSTHPHETGTSLGFTSPSKWFSIIWCHAAIKWTYKKQ